MTAKAFTLSAMASFMLGILSLFTSEARCTRNWVHSITNYPGLWRGWLGSFIGWLAIFVTIAFVLARILVNRRNCVRGGQAIRWGALVLAILSVLAFTAINVMWGVRTNWTFIK